MSVVTTVPTQKFRSRKTRKSTMGPDVRNSRTISTERATTEMMLNQAIQVLANQSCSCPLSRTIWRVASQTAWLDECCL
jgi:hypothetical protein